MTTRSPLLLLIVLIVAVLSTVNAFFPRACTNSMTLTSSWVTTLQMSKAAHEEEKKKKRQQAMQAQTIKQGETDQSSSFQEAMDDAEQHAKQ